MKFDERFLPMTSKLRSPKIFRFAIILLVLIAFPFAIPSFAKHRRASSARSRSGRADRRGRHSASARRGSRRGGRSVARRGGRSRRLSTREVRAARNRIAREQTSSLERLERRCLFAR